MRRLQPILPLVLVPRIGAFEAERLRPALEADVGDLGERDVVRVRPLVIPPADVEPHAVRGQALGRGVEEGHVALGDAAELVVGLVAILVVARRAEVGAIDLQHKTGRDDGAVFGLHRLGERRDIGVLVLVVEIDDEAREDAGRRRGHEGLGRVRLRDRCAQMREVALERLRIGIGDGADAAGKRRHGEVRVAVAEVGMLEPVAPDHDVAAFLRRALVGRDAGKAMADIERVGELAHLAVAHDVDAGFDLALHHVRDSAGAIALERGLVQGAPLLLRHDLLEQRLGPRQAADMGGEDAVCARLHGLGLLR